MSIDAGMLKACKHVGGKYTSTGCPVCSGTGFYMDLVLDQTGSPLQIDGINKVVQQTVHHFMSEEGDYADYGYPEYGSRIQRLIGGKNTSETRLRFHVLRDLQYLTQVKEAQHRRYGNIDGKEIIREIIAIDVQNTADEQSVALSAIVGDNDEIQFFTVGKFVNLG